MWELLALCLVRVLTSDEHSHVIIPTGFDAGMEQTGNAGAGKAAYALSPLFEDRAWRRFLQKSKDEFAKLRVAEKRVAVQMVLVRHSRYTEEEAITAVGEMSFAAWEVKG